MKHKDHVMVTAIYHPKPGYEDEFVRVWNDRVCSLAYEGGAEMMGVYHNEDTEEFFATGHWPTKQAAERFLNSRDLQEATHEINRLCLVPVTRELFEILREAAA